MTKWILMQILRTAGGDKIRLRRPFRAAWAVVFLAATLLVSHASGQADIYVTTTGSDPLGAEWTSATSFTNALSKAQPNDIIWLKAGTYTNDSTFLVTTNGLQIYGGFDGTETDLSQRNWTNHVVTLDGQDTRLVIEIRAQDVTLDGLTITNGRNTNNAIRKGGGLRMDGGSYPATNLTLANCWVVDNYDAQDSSMGGGAYFENAGNILISNCVFELNSVNRGWAGGIWSKNSDLTVADSRISDNHTGGAYRKHGDGIYFEGSTSTLDIRRCEIIDNGNTSGGNSGYGGGGVYIKGGIASIVNTVIARNRSSKEGGGVRHAAGTLTIESCTFVTNMPASTSVGGAIYQAGGIVTVKNCIFWDNQAGTDGVDDGDTIYQAAGTLNLSYSCLDGTNAPRVVCAGTLNPGLGIITNDPLFAVEYTDVHLKSKFGRWDGSDWVRDDVSSPCIDAGDPASDESLEPDGIRINLGAYGNTPEASQFAAKGTVFIIR